MIPLFNPALIIEVHVSALDTPCCHVDVQQLILVTWGSVSVVRTGEPLLVTYVVLTWPYDVVYMYVFNTWNTIYTCMF